MGPSIRAAPGGARCLESQRHAIGPRRAGDPMIDEMPNGPMWKQKIQGGNASHLQPLISISVGQNGC